MAEGDPNGVFRRGHMPSLYRRRYYTPSSVTVTYSFTRHPQPKTIPDDSIIYNQTRHRRFSPLQAAPTVVYTFSRRRQLPQQADISIIYAQHMHRRFSPLAIRRKRAVLFTVT